MKSLKSAFSHLLFHKSMPVVACNMSIDAWFPPLCTQPTRFIRKVEICTATAGEYACGTPVDKLHLHTVLRVFLMPTSGGTGASEDALLIERVLCTDGAYHSVTPVSEALSTGGALSHPDVCDRICVISDGPSTALAHNLEVERVLTFSNRSREPCLTLAQFAQIVEFVSRTTMLICTGGDCKFQSRSFAFTCLAALAPNFPPPMLIRNGDEGVGMNVGDSTDSVDDWVFELGAETFLVQIPWLVRDPMSVRTLELIKWFKDEPRGRKTARLYY